MQYFSNYKNCKRYYDIYNRYLKCREYQEFQHAKDHGTISFYYYINWDNYNINTYLHNINGPARIHYFQDGRIQKQYYINSIRHNKHGPAEIVYYKNGSIIFERYYINGLIHNKNGPAEIHYFENGQKKREMYFINGFKHYSNGGESHLEFYEYGGKRYNSFKKNYI